MHSFYRILSLPLAAILLLSSLCACDTNSASIPDTSDTQTASPVTTEAPEPSINLIVDGASDFTLVRPENAGEPLTAATVELRRSLEKRFGCGLSIASDWVKKTEEVPRDTCEILIGQTNRTESKDAVAALGDASFIIKVASDKRIVILGRSEEATIAAIQTFISRYVEPGAGQTLSLPLDTRFDGYTFEQYAEVRELSTNLIAAPSMICRADSADAMAEMEKNAPATAILRINGDEVVAADGSRLGSFATVMQQLNGKIIPAFAVETQADADHLLTLLSLYSVKDFFVVSKEAGLLADIIAQNSLARGVIDYSDMRERVLSEDDIYAIRAEVNGVNARIALLPAWMADQHTVQYLQIRLITVWVESAGDDISLMQAITSGANGVVVRTGLPALERCMHAYFAPNTLIRPVFVIGHRGIPSQAPENTVEGSLLAYEKGANIIENDVYLSKDGEIVIMHDSTIDRTTNGTGKIESMTLAQIKTYLVNKSNAAKFPDAKIPTLREYFEAFRGTDAQIFIELKTKKLDIIPKLVALIREYNMANQVSVIAFSTDMMQAIKAQCPELSVGYLVSNYTDPKDTYGSLKRVNELVGAYHTTFNQNYTNLTPEFITAAAHRGISLWPWTLNDGGVFFNHFRLGLNGITTNYASYVSNMVHTLRAEQSQYTTRVGETVSPVLHALTYARNENGHIPADIDEAAVKIVFLAGESNAQVNGLTVTPAAPGDITFIYSLTTQTLMHDQYCVVTQPITIHAT